MWRPEQLPAVHSSKITSRYERLHGEEFLSNSVEMSSSDSARPEVKPSSAVAINAEDVPMSTETRNRSVLFTLLVACGALSFGLSIGLTGPLSALTSATKDCLPDEFSGNKSVFSLFVSLLNLGAMFGAVSGGVIADKLGRRGAFLVACSISLLGSSCIVFGYAVWILNAGR